jgi:hypothetical protein
MIFLRVIVCRLSRSQGPPERFRYREYDASVGLVDVLQTASRGHFHVGSGRFALSHVMRAEIRFISSDKAGTRRLP